MMTAKDVRIPREIADTLVNVQAHADQRLHDALKWLRANQPLGYAEPSSTEPFWVATRQADIKALAMENKTFLSGERNITLIEREHEKRARELAAGRPAPVRAIVQMDLPDHFKYRAVAAPHLRPAEVSQLADRIRPIAKEFIDRLASCGGECDFAEQVAFLYPLRVIMNVLGVPQEDERLMLRLTQEYMGSTDADQARGAVVKTGQEAAEQAQMLVAEFNAYFDAMLADRRKKPRNDLVSIIANATIDGGPMPELESRSYCFVAATAGHDTTSAATAGGVWALCEHPDQFQKVKNDRSLISGLVEEAVRWTSPSKITMRAAARDVELCGRSFSKGDWLGLAWASANRDEEVFEDPYTFRVDRDPNRLLAFGWGAHNCIGQHLARLEMRILFEEFFNRVASVELSGPPASVASFMVSGPKRVPVRYKLH